MAREGPKWTKTNVHCIFNYLIEKQKHVNQWKKIIKRIKIIHSILQMIQADEQIKQLKNQQKQK